VLAAACDLARSTGRTLETAIALGLSGTWWSLRADGACRLLGAAERMRELLGTAAPPYERIVRERGLRAVKAALDDRTAAGAWERGRRLGFEGAMAQAQALASGPPERS
jgi:hypothetical protein